MRNFSDVGKFIYDIKTEGFKFTGEKNSRIYVRGQKPVKVFIYKKDGMVYEINKDTGEIMYFGIKIEDEKDLPLKF